MRPRYTFGFGLSYTKFGYSDLTIEPQQLNDVNENIEITVSVRVTNLGLTAGADVVQVYMKPEGSGIGEPKVLRGFSKVFLQPTASLTETIKINARRALSRWDPSSETWRLRKGLHTVTIGLTGVLEGSMTSESEVDWLGL